MDSFFKFPFTSVFISYMYKHTDNSNVTRFRVRWRLVRDGIVGPVLNSSRQSPQEQRKLISAVTSVERLKVSIAFRAYIALCCGFVSIYFISLSFYKRSPSSAC